MTTKRLFRTLMFALVVTAQLAACGESNAPDEPPSPTPAPTPTPTPPPPPPPQLTDGEAAVAAVLAVMDIGCTKGFECAGGSDDFPFESSEECVAMIEQLLIDNDVATRVDEGELAFDAANAATCLELLPAAVEAQTCEEFLSSNEAPVAECDALLDGLFPEGEE